MEGELEPGEEITAARSSLSGDLQRVLNGIWLLGSLNRAGTSSRDHRAGIRCCHHYSACQDPVTSALAMRALLVPSHGSDSGSLVRAELKLMIPPALGPTIHAYFV